VLANSQDLGEELPHGADMNVDVEIVHQISASLSLLKLWRHTCRASETFPSTMKTALNYTFGRATSNTANFYSQQSLLSTDDLPGRRCCTVYLRSPGGTCLESDPEEPAGPVPVPSCRMPGTCKSAPYTATACEQYMHWTTQSTHANGLYVRTRAPQYYKDTQRSASF
jgi:hypothetical protein